MVTRTRIKICGLKTAAAVSVCKEAGADAVGFVFYAPSPRYVEPAHAQQLCQALGPWQTPVALFVNPAPEQVHAVLACMPNALLQFHGDESPRFCASFARPYLKAIRMQAGTDLHEQARQYASAQGLLVDSWSEAYGGSGQAFDWLLLPKPGSLPLALILSGGLHPENLQEAISNCQPYGVDVSSGVESSKGVKCETKIRAFCRAVQQADAAL
ncbi:MAG: phosphoribosylanthranilate isomerase [Limnobacter sp.]|nr:phosphoribosylanthranilate isomerase [Limnobacter sp.]